MKIVISLGGSLINPGKINYNFLKEFKNTIKKFSGYKIVIVTGGGKTARDYIKALHYESDDMKSLVGIMATKLNARLVSGLFNLNEDIPDNFIDVKRELNKEGIVVCGGLGFQANMTSDGNAAELAKYFKAKMFINLTNVNGLFDKDPKKFKDVKLINKISYDKFLKIANKIKYEPGQHFVLDQTAAKLIKKYKIKTYIINGKNLNNLYNLLKNKKYVGTLIS